jgi:hypothetical protein
MYVVLKEYGTPQALWRSIDVVAGYPGLSLLKRY